MREVVVRQTSPAFGAGGQAKRISDWPAVVSDEVAAGWRIVWSNKGD